MNAASEMKLWTKEIPFALPSDSSKKEHFLDPSGDGINRLTDVVQPTLAWFPASGKGPHPAVVVCPGGGYGILAWNHEGLDICAFLNTIGITAFLLKYRCPDRRDGAHADASRALRLIRSRAEEFGIRQDKVGIIGFSAGAHLAATISAPANTTPYPAADAVDKFSCKPDFTVLIYPAYLADESLNLAPEFKIDDTVPPTFLIQAEDDCIQVENSLAWFIALKRAGVKAELHVYPEGGHGYGLLRTGNPIADWPVLAGAWIKKQCGIL